MFIFKSNQKRANPYAPYTSPDGVRYAQIPLDLLDEIADPTPPADYSDDTYYRTEQDDAPYVVYTKKSDEQLAQVRWNKLKVLRDDKMMNGGCKVEVSVGVFKWFHSDTHSKLQQASLKAAGAELPAGIMWKTMDGSFVEMTPALANSLFWAQLATEQAIFTVAETKKNDSTDVQAGWPETYQEAANV
jgi:hypothetical protein